MEEIILIKKNAYFDSVTLMTLSNKLLKQAGIKDAVVAMATPMNKDLLQNIGMINEDILSAGTNDLIIAIRGESQDACSDAKSLAEQTLGGSNSKGGSAQRKDALPKSIKEAVKKDGELNLAVISVAGEFAAREAKEALKSGLHVMLFSDNVSEEDEAELKAMAHERNLLMMGPDCGTAIINNVGLCFANKIRKGCIGLVGASGTGLQEITVQIDRLEEGVSQVIGTGGRDLSAAIGGRMFLDAFQALQDDQDTKVIVLVSKPPAKEVAERIMAAVKECPKPVVVCFIGSKENALNLDQVVIANSLEDAAVKAVRVARGEAVESQNGSVYPLPVEEIKAAQRSLSEKQKYIRGLYCGGTLAAEAVAEISGIFKNVYSNVAKKPEQKLADPHVSREHTVVDLGDDLFTLGRPHPMIEPELRIERISQEGRDDEVAVLVLDFALGTGSHSNPVGITLEALRKIKIPIVAYVMGSEMDSQGKEGQIALLQKEGVIIGQSNRHAIEIALAIAERRRV